MNSPIIYLVELIATSGLLYGYYHFALRNKKFHLYNRFYLLGAALISIIIPFLYIPVYLTQEQVDSSIVIKSLHELSGPIISAQSSKPGASSGIAKWLSGINLDHLLYFFYFLVATIILARIIISLLKIKGIIKRNEYEVIDNIHFINTNEPGTPFSFFRWLFWNRKIELRSVKGEQIFRHEIYHINQHHSRDIMFIELLSMILWINPFFHLMRKELKTIHEFLADEYAASERDSWQYAELLLMQLLNTNNQLVNPFFHNQIKRRIAMITSSTKPSYQYLRKLFVLPIAAILILLFSFKYEQSISKEGAVAGNDLNKNMVSPIQDTSKPNENLKLAEVQKENLLKIREVTVSDTIGNPNGQPLIVLDGKVLENMAFEKIDKEVPVNSIERINVLKDKSAKDKYGEKARFGVIEIFTKKEDAKSVEKYKEVRDNITFDKVEETASFPGGNREWRKFLERNLDASVPIENGSKPGTYTVIAQFIVDGEGNISDLKTLTNHGYGMEQEVLRVIKDGPKWVPAKQNGKIVKSYKKQPITFVVVDETNTIPKEMSDKISLNPVAEEYKIDQLNEVVVTGFAKPAGKLMLKEPDNGNKEVENLQGLEEKVVTGYRKEIPKEEIDKLSSIYPNPANSTIAVPYKSEFSGKGEIKIYDINGSLKLRSAVSFNKGNNSFTVDIATLASGAYIVNVVSPDKKTASMYKLIKN